MKPLTLDDIRKAFADVMKSIGVKWKIFILANKQIANQARRRQS